MAFLQKQNNAKTTLAEDIAIAEADWDVTDGSVFPASGDFMLTVWDESTYPDPSDDPNMEIVRATARAGNTITVTRAQELTSDVAHSSGDTVAMLITAGTFDEHLDQNVKTSDDVEFHSVTLTSDQWVGLGSDLGRIVVDTAYSDYITDRDAVVVKDCDLVIGPTGVTSDSYKVIWEANQGINLYWEMYSEYNASGPKLKLDLINPTPITINYAMFGFYGFEFICKNIKDSKFFYDASNYLGLKVYADGEAVFDVTGTDPEFTFKDKVTIENKLYIKDKICFTQTDENEYIDSLVDGELDLEATTSVNLRVNSAEIVQVTATDLRPATDDTYYLGKNDDDTPFAWKGVILKDTSNGKYYRIEVTNGSIVATDLTD